MRYLITIGFFLLHLPAWAQLQTDGTVTLRNSEVLIKEGTSIYIPGHLNDSTVGTQLIDGRDYEGAVASSGIIYIGKSLYNKGEQKFNITDGKIVFNGTDLQFIDGNPVTFYDLELDKDTALVPYHFIKVDNDLRMSRGYVNLDSIISGVDLGTTGQVLSETNTSRIFGEKGRLFAIDRNLTGNSPSVAGLGLATSGSLGLTDVERFNLHQAGATDKGSIKRYFSLKPTNKNQLMNSIEMKYFDAEVDGFDDQIFALWNSNNQGVVWNRYIGTVNTLGNEVSAQDIQFGNGEEELLTVADSICNSGPQFELHPTREIAICEGTAFDLAVPLEGLFYRWSTGETTRVINISSPGTYYVVATDANGCYSTDTVDVVDKPFPQVDFEVPVAGVCLGGTTTFNNTSTIDEGTMTFEWDFGINNNDTGVSTDENPTFDYANYGNFEVTLIATSDFECISEVSKITTVHPLPEVSFTAAEVCEGTPMNFVNNSSIPNTGNDALSTFEWDFNFIEGETFDIESTETAPSFTYAAFGDYTAKMIATSNNGCSNEGTAAVRVNPNPVVDFTANDVCFGEDIGLDNLSTIAEGDLNYTWTFSDGTSSNIAFPGKTFSAPGVYDITLTASSPNSCQESVTKSVEVFAIPDPDFTFEDICAGEFVQFVNTTTLSTADAISYSWTVEGGRTSNNISPEFTFNEPGDYTITLTATTENNCEASISKTLNVSPVPIADFTVENVCEGEPVRPRNRAAISSGSMSFEWLIDGVRFSSAENPTFNNLSAGTYELTLEVRSNDFCEASISKSFQVFELPEMPFSSNVSTCGSTLTLDAGNPGATYLWSNNSRGQQLVVTQSGFYEVEITSPNGCTTTASTIVSLDSEFVPNLPANVTACDVATLDAGNPGSQSYRWSTGETTRTIEVSESGTYVVEIVDQNGCEGSQSVAVTITDTPQISLPSVVTVCEGEEVILDTQLSGFTHSWNTGETTQSISPNRSGIYQVTVSNGASCSATSRVEVIINPSPSVDLGPDRFACDQISLDLFGQNLTYLWSDGTTSPSLISQQSGEYWVEVTNPFGCTARDTVVLTIAPSPQLVLPADISLCNGESITFDAGNPGANYLWSNGSEEQVIEVSSTGTYSVLVSNESGCSIERQVNVVVQPKVVVDLSQDLTICSGSEVTLSANVTTDQYLWTNDNGQLSSQSSITVSEAGQYVLQATTAEGCFGRDTVEIFVSEEQLESRFLMTSEANIGDSVQFKSISLPIESDHLWQFGDGVTSGQEDPIRRFFTPGVYQVSLTISNDICSDVSEKTLTIIDPTAGRIENQEETEELNLFITPFVKDTISVVNVYPNPFSNVFTLDLEKPKDGPLAIYFHDLNGKLWYVEEFDQLKQLTRSYNWSTLPAGVYIISFVTPEERITRRLLKL